MQKNNWTEQDDTRLIELFHNNHTSREIATLMKRSYSHIRKRGREFGLKTKMGMMMEEQKLARLRGKGVCRACGKEKPVSDFSTRGIGNKYLRSICDKCEASRAINRYRNKTLYSLDETVHKRVYQAKRRAMKKGVEFDLTDSDIIDLYNKQNGKCHYSGIPMEKIPKMDNYYNVSIDRVESHRGYTLDNVVLCCDSVNTMKNAMPRDVFIDICKKIVSHQKW